MVERTDDQPGAGSATYCSAVSLRQASRTLVLAQRSYANNATTSSCTRISPGQGPAIQPVRLRPAFGGSSTLDSGPRLQQALDFNPIVPRVIDPPRGDFRFACGEYFLSASVDVTGARKKQPRPVGASVRENGGF